MFSTLFRVTMFVDILGASSRSGRTSGPMPSPSINETVYLP